MEEPKDFKGETIDNSKEGFEEEMPSKCIYRKIKVKSHYRRDGLFRKKVKGYTKEVCIPKKKVETKRKVSPKKKYGYWYK